MKIEYVGFEKNFSIRLIWLSLFIFSYLITILFVRMVITKRRRKTSLQKLIVSYEPLEVENYSDEDTKRIVSFIAKNYSNPDLDVAGVGREVGLSQTKISVVLKTSMECSFKQCLNNIRITEAKRLLRTSDRQIADISRKVGYNNVAHFNRIFKAVEGLTPNQYRKVGRNSD